MARKVSKPSLIPSPWYAVLWILSLAVVVLLGVIWYSGSTEATDALSSSRRMVIDLKTGEVQGVKPADSRKAALLKQTQGAAPVADQRAVVPTAEALAPVNPLLQEQAKAGLLPIIGPDGTKPWRYYSRPYEHRGGMPMVAIVVSGLGTNTAVTDAAMRLPADISLSFSSYAQGVEKWVDAARTAGHEVLMDLPLEPNDYPATDPGPNAMLTGQTTEENQKGLQQVMGSAAAYVGLLTPQNEQFTANNDYMRLLLQDISNHGLLLVFSHEPHKTETREIIDASNTPAIIGDVWIDEDISEEVIQERLATLEQIAKKRGYAIGFAQALPITIDQIRQWSTTLEKRGIVLVPVTFIAKPRFS